MKNEYVLIRKERLVLIVDELDYKGRNIGRKVIPNITHVCYNEMWDWDREDRIVWDIEYGDYWESKRSKKKRDT